MCAELCFVLIRHCDIQDCVRAQKRIFLAEYSLTNSSLFKSQTIRAEIQILEQRQKTKAFGNAHLTEQL